ncbi:hypothetical protein CLCR_01749 [Cladophialophora carrionii]|uniref:Uncharacterized protein n=1 Tax=Cladophialophora carrionii TaxID=86049 RepID=A0A1C1CAB8_9EURO|nr:hypothetical protein CLCR_01749 [Cladophialophora carrionii]
MSGHDYTEEEFDAQGEHDEDNQDYHENVSDIINELHQMQEAMDHLIQDMECLKDHDTWHKVGGYLSRLAHQFSILEQEYKQHAHQHLSHMSSGGWVHGGNQEWEDQPEEGGEHGDGGENKEGGNDEDGDKYGGDGDDYGDGW